jgi:D-tyrosyl-tRNA(Tyr) deacylase
MIAVVQRVSKSLVTIGEEIAGAIDGGLLVLLGVAKGDMRKDADYLSEKIVHLRIFEDGAGKMNRSLIDTGGSMLVVSQFTLLGDCRKGRRPSFINAAPPDLAQELYDYFVEVVRDRRIHVETGRFRAAMAVSLVNDGPVTLILTSPSMHAAA